MVTSPYWTLASNLPNHGVSSCLLGASWRTEDVGCPGGDSRHPFTKGGGRCPGRTSRGLTQKALQHGLDAAGDQRLLQGRRQPRLGMLLAMPPN